MDRDEILRRPLVAVFAVVRPDGRVHATPLWFHWDGNDLNLIVERDSRRHRWAVEAGRAAVCVETVEAGELAFVTAEGPITVVDPLTAEARYRMWERYVGPERARTVVDGGGHETKVLLVLHPETWIPAGA
ncbi:MAG TPA: pyridoxamine 5'-phosphate oxidase family protein [Patescibacteria group bacterium]|nr:pyridoxamine 5'-phosphate oxidase family protein [Patescibacteria group bacterium]